MTMIDLPVLVENIRGPLVESRHRGCIAVVQPDGRVFAKAGDISHVTFMRSTAKPIQALPLLTSGSFDRFGLAATELAVVVSSHSGEPIHTREVWSFLRKLGLDTSYLRCGVHAASDWGAEGKVGGASLDVLQNNCSGKHAGMLAQCLAEGAELARYEQPEHVVQQRILDCVALLTRTRTIEIGVESCTVPTFAVSVGALALAYSRLVNPRELPAHLRSACNRVIQAMLDYPELVGGTEGRSCTQLMNAYGRTLIAKEGAEGVYALAILPSNDFPHGLGIAVKIEDGDNAAAVITVLETLRQLSPQPHVHPEQIDTALNGQLRSFRGTVVGHRRAIFRLS
jgi:L-asparaginase II